MKKIKPVVIGYKRVYRDGDVSNIILSKRIMKSSLGLCGPYVYFHLNGKQKFRPVYKKESK